MVVFDTIVISAAVIAVFIASLFDIKTREIPDWVSYGLVIFVLLTRGLESILSKTHSHFTYSVLTMLIFFGFGALMYYTKQWGGGDAKLIAGLGASFAETPSHLINNSILPFPGILIVNILILGAIYGAIYASYLAIKNKNAFKKEFLKINREKNIRHIKVIMLILGIVMAFISYILFPINTKLIGGIFALIILLLPYLIISLKSVELSCMYKQLLPSKLTEGDWVQKDIYKGKKLIYKTKPYGIDLKSINLLKKAKIKQVLIKEGIPFVPSFLLGTLATLVLGRIIFIPFI